MTYLNLDRPLSSSLLTLLLQFPYNFEDGGFWFFWSLIIGSPTKSHIISLNFVTETRRESQYMNIQFYSTWPKPTDLYRLGTFSAYIYDWYGPHPDDFFLEWCGDVHVLRLMLLVPLSFHHAKQLLGKCIPANFYHSFSPYFPPFSPAR